MNTIIFRASLLLALLAGAHPGIAQAISPFDWTDQLAAVTTSENSTAAETGKLTDNQVSTIFNIPYANGTWIEFETRCDLKLTGYAITSGSQPETAPQAWTVEASADGTEWETIDSRQEVSFGTLQTNAYQLAFPSDRETIRSWRRIRFTFHANGGSDRLAMAELQLFGFPAQLTTDVTGNGGMIRAEHTGYPGEGVENLIGNKISKKYCVTGHTAGWVEYVSAAKVRLTSYSLTSCVANTERDPKAWRLDGFNEDTFEWETIDEQRDQQFPVRFCTMVYPVGSRQAYSRFRLTITANNGGSDFQFCKWQLEGTATTGTRTKVACVGNSITENSALAEPYKYPSRLQTILGEQYQVLNYGLGGRTLLKKGNQPYWNESKYDEVKGWQPDIVVVKIGTNDSKASNWQYKEEFVSDYVEFVRSFQNLDSRPAVYLCKPIPAWDNNMNIRGSVIRDEICPLVDEVAAQTGTGVIDLYAALDGCPSLVYDGVHPNNSGTYVMAHVIAHALIPAHELPADLYAQTATSDWTDGASMAASATDAMETLPLLTDNDPSTTWSATPFAPGSWIQADLGQSVKLTGYAITAGQHTPAAPSSWTLQGSSDGNAWVTIDSQSGISFAHARESRLYSIPLPDNRDALPAYAHYRLVVHANNGGTSLDMAEWQLLGFPAQLVTPITGNGGTMTGEHAGYSGEGAENLNSASIMKKYCANSRNTGWVEYESPAKVRLTGYALVSGVTNFERNPRSWQLMGYDFSSDTWELIDERHDQLFLGSHSTLTFPIDTDKSYTRFRLYVTENCGDSNMQFCKWLLYGETTAPPTAKVKVACIGNSITANAKLEEKDRYASILNRLLGEDYTVKNCGEGGATILKGSTHPYWEQTVYQTALSFAPDIIVVKFGTNDSNPDNWKKKDHFVSDYVEFIQSFRNVNPGVQVFLCYPITSWHSTMPIVDKTVVEEVIPLIDEVARQTGATIIDLHTPTFGKVYQTYDYVHPDVRGTTLMANTIYKAIVPDGDTPVMPASYISKVDRFDRTDRRTGAAASTDADLDALFDNDLATECHFGAFRSGTWFQIELPADFRTTGYAITTASGDIRNTPRTWTLQVSSDGENWTDIDRRSGQPFFYPTETNLYQIDIEGNSAANARALPAGRFLRMIFYENNGGEELSLSEFQLYGMNKTLRTGITANGGTITGQYPGFQYQEYNEVVTNLIDDDIATKYCVTGHTGGWVQYESAEPVVPGAYALSSCVSYITRRPRAWQLLGSSDGYSWTLLDEQADENLFMRLNSVEYPISTNEAYRYFRLNITGNGGDDNFEFAKWQIFSREEVSGINQLTHGSPNNDATYNIMGQRVGSSFRGLAIRNGRKIIMR